MCLFVYAVDHGVTEEEPVDEQYREQVCEDQYRDPESDGQYLDQDFPEGFVNGKFNLILWCIFCPGFINTTYWPVFKTAYCFAAKTRLDNHSLIALIIPW